MLLHLACNLREDGVTKYLSIMYLLCPIADTTDLGTGTSDDKANGT